MNDCKYANYTTIIGVYFNEQLLLRSPIQSIIPTMLFYLSVLCARGTVMPHSIDQLVQESPMTIHSP